MNLLVSQVLSGLEEKDYRCEVRKRASYMKLIRGVRLAGQGGIGREHLKS